MGFASKWSILKLWERKVRKKKLRFSTSDSFPLIMSHMLFPLPLTPLWLLYWKRVNSKWFVYLLHLGESAIRINKDKLRDLMLNFQKLITEGNIVSREGAWSGKVIKFDMGKSQWTCLLFNQIYRANKVVYLQPKMSHGD